MIHRFALLARPLLPIAVVVSAGLIGCASVPTAPPPIPPRPGDVVSAGAMVYDTADTDFFIGGGQTWAKLHLGPLIDVGGSLQMSTGRGGKVRMLGGSLLVGGRLQINEGLLLGAELTGEYVDAFTYRLPGREPIVMLTVAAPVIFKPLPDLWFWVRPAIGGGADLRLQSSLGGVQPISSGAFPVWRLSYGAAWDLSWVTLYGESSTTLPFGGAYLGFGAAFSL